MLEAFFEDKVFTEQEFIISQKSQVPYPVGFVKCIWIFKTWRRPVEAIYKIRKTWTDWTFFFLRILILFEMSSVYIIMLSNELFHYRKHLDQSDLAMT